MHKRSDYLYNLPEELIAQQPAARRDESRLLVYDRKSKEMKHKTFSSFPDLLDPGDVLVLNNTRVIPARLIGKRSSGGEAEILLLSEVRDLEWMCLVKPGRRLKIGQLVHFTGGVRAKILEMHDEGKRLVRFHGTADFHSWLEQTGRPPLPPYIKRDIASADLERYQTVYARENGAVAAPTAGLHFTDEILDQLQKKKIKIVHLTLHVGIGTFRPVSVENLDDHKMDAERYIVSKDAADAINSVRAEGGRVVAVGTTVVRTLETVTDETRTVHAGSGESALFIRPPYTFKAVDSLLTNFHLPGSTLLMLVSALMGREETLRAYNEAVAHKYRFFSYGDAMFIQLSLKGD
ncbi:tRNA preQ1(34) S-adenosylmethionine ribosyltransferase-isomerase QueA [bacterium]|nr:tRNA preQ1(34) S-adenosylmethionine ribosyltransferase-isomerase QueA [bacterium]